MPRIGLTQRVEVVSDRNERRDCLDQAWTTLLIAHQLCPVPLPNAVESAERLVADLALDGVILTGGNDLVGLSDSQEVAPERDRLEHALLDVCAGRRIPVLGVCRGMQIMTTHYGGRLDSVSDHVGTRHAITVCRSDGIALTNRDSVNSFHRFGVYADALGGVLMPLAIAPDGSVEALRHKNAPQWAVMWHPERAPSNEQDAQLIKTIFGGEVL